MSGRDRRGGGFPTGKEGRAEKQARDRGRFIHPWDVESRRSFRGTLCEKKCILVDDCEPQTVRAYAGVGEKMETCFWSLGFCSVLPCRVEFPSCFGNQMVLFSLKMGKFLSIVSREMSKSGFVTLPSVTGSSGNIHSPQPPTGTSAVRLPSCLWPFAFDGQQRCGVLVGRSRGPRVLQLPTGEQSWLGRWGWRWAFPGRSRRSSDPFDGGR